jgi:hypothetical protein
MRFRLGAELGTREFGEGSIEPKARNSVWCPSRSFLQVVAQGETVAFAAKAATQHKRVAVGLISLWKRLFRNWLAVARWFLFG